MHALRIFDNPTPSPKCEIYALNSFETLARGIALGRVVLCNHQPSDTRAISAPRIVFLNRQHVRVEFIHFTNVRFTNFAIGMSTALDLHNHDFIKRSWRMWREGEQKVKIISRLVLLRRKVHPKGLHIKFVIKQVPPRVKKPRISHNDVMDIGDLLRT